MPSRTILIPVEVRHFHLIAVDPLFLRCFACDLSLELHQPLAEEPESLLGTCRHCRAWYAINRPLEESEVVMVHLPMPLKLRHAVLATHPGSSEGVEASAPSGPSPA
jgi:hypothetical protein